MKTFNRFDRTYGLSPCYKCKDRQVGCHSNCKRYKAFRKRIEKIKNNL